MEDLLREQAAYYRACAGEYDLAYDKLGSLDVLMSGLRSPAGRRQARPPRLSRVLSRRR